MNIFPAIDIIGAKAVRLTRGDYNQMTVYSNSPLDVAKGFESDGAKFLHVVDLEGAKDGTTPNFETIKNIASSTSLFIEVGGGIRSIETIEKYLSIGVSRVILGTAAITKENFVKDTVRLFGDKIAVGVDVKDGKVAIKGWTEVSDKTCFDFCRELEDIGVKTVICTDISKDGVLGGTNINLYRELNSTFNIDFIASGGVSTLDDIKTLASENMYGAILGKALYTKNINLKDALEIAKVAKV